MGKERTKLVAQGYYLSDAAYQGLITQAQVAGYVHKPCKRANGLPSYLEALCMRVPSQPRDLWQDTRPPGQSDADPDLAAAGFGPDWTSPEPYRLGRTVRLSRFAELQFMRLAVEFNIADRRKARPSVQSLVGAVLEVIGLGWLTCSRPPGLN